MRLLFISNFYPPLSFGGYEQWCQEVAEGLRDRGHQIDVLTSRYGNDQTATLDPSWVHRTLYLEMEINSVQNNLKLLTSHRTREKANLHELRRLIEIENPDAVLVWGMWNLSLNIPAFAEQLRPGKVIYYLGDYWPLLPSQIETYWTIPARSWKTYWPKRLLRPITLRVLAREEKPKLYFDKTIFASNFLRDEYTRKGLILKDSTIIYGAVDTRPYLSINILTEKKDSRTTLLYIGRLSQDKGVHTCIQAMGILKNNTTNGSIDLIIVGTGEKEYETYLCNLAKDEKVDDWVIFKGARPKSELPGIYQDADIFLFPSIWPEPFGRVLVEAMAAGLPVIGTAVGGAVEILNDRENGLTFTPDDPESLATQITRLIKMPELRKRLVESGRKTALEKFDLHRMVSELEIYLQTIVNS